MAYKEKVRNVRGKAGNQIFIFTLSTCVWCMKTKDLLNRLGFEYGYVDVDLLNKDDQEEVRKDFDKYSTDFAFPKIIINGKILSGYDEMKIRGALR